MRTVLTPLAVLVLVALPSPQSTATAGRLPLRLADLVSDASTIVVGDVIALRDAAGESVAEVHVVDLLKGELPGDTVFYSARPLSWDPGEPKVGERALLLLDSDEKFQGTRAFWKALDRLRAGRPFRPLAFGGHGRMPMIRPTEGGDPVVRLYDVILPPDVLAWLPEGSAPESPRRLVDAASLVESVRKLCQ
jgi:hypothetical protein